MTAVLVFLVILGFAFYMFVIRKKDDKAAIERLRTSGSGSTRASASARASSVSTRTSGSDDDEFVSIDDIKKEEAGLRKRHEEMLRKIQVDGNKRRSSRVDKLKKAQDYEIAALRTSSARRAKSRRARLASMIE